MIAIQDRLKVLDGVALESGPHTDELKGSAVCALELINLVLTGDPTDKLPCNLTSTLSALPVLNDGPWRNTVERSATIVPYLRRLLLCDRDAVIDQRIAFRLADYTMRVIVSEALNSIGMKDCAEMLQTIPITDKASAIAAEVLADSLVHDHAEMGVNTALACALHAAFDDSGEAAVSASITAIVVARQLKPLTSKFFTKYTRSILEIIVDSYGV